MPDIIKKNDEKQNNVITKAQRQLSKYSFEEKLGYCFNHALSITGVADVELHQKNEIYPWELEFLIELSLFAKEEQSSLEPFSINEMERIVNDIRNYRHTHFQVIEETFLRDIIIALSATQFKVQENYYHRLYRFNYYFNYEDDSINVKRAFRKMFGCDYNEYMSLAILVHFFMGREVTEISKDAAAKIWEHIFPKHSLIIKNLSITREEYIARQDEKNNGALENGLYGFNYLHSFPFIVNNDNLYLPLPYLIVDAVTDSLLTRLTNEDEKLRELMGKHVAENYLYHILHAGDAYDEVCKEIPYKKGKNSMLAPDVMIREGNYICLLDSKLSTPSIGLRQFDEITIDTITSRYAGYVEQLYKRINDFELYNPFEKNNNYTRERIFGIVCIQEDSFVLRERIYEAVIEELGYKEGDPESDYIVSHIMILPLTVIEGYAVSSTSLFPAIKERCCKRSMWLDFSLNDAVNDNDEPQIIAPYRDYINRSLNVIMRTVEALGRNNIILS